MIRVLGSNKSCVNRDCENFVNDEYDRIFVNYDSYEDISDLDFESLPDNVESDYVEEYDDYLYFSDNSNYITRFEYRKMNNFIEDYLFKGNRIAQFERYLEDDGRYNLGRITEKYELLVKGRNLEKENLNEARDFYYSIFRNPLFANDYYIYKKLVKLEKDHYKNLDLIFSFFNSGIYCNRYHYLWFLKKLYQLTKKIDIPMEDIDEALYNFRNNGFNKRKFSDDPVPIAEKITNVKYKINIRTDEEYTLRQFKYELTEEASNLKNLGHLHYSNEILEKLILKHHFKAVRLFEKICNTYHTLGDYENEIKWVYAYFNRTKRFNNANDIYFLNRLKLLGVETNEFNHYGLFFDENEHYLTKEDFKKNKKDAFEIVDYISLIKDKYSMILEGLKLEKSNPQKAVNYYKSILDHELFKNDYYVYKALVMLYDDMGIYKEIIETIVSFFKSGIFCDRYNYLFFLFHLKKLSYMYVIHDDMINDCLKSFKEVSFKNRNLENTPAPVSERLKFSSNELGIIPHEEFQIQQELDALDLESQLFESSGMLRSANEIFKIMINEYGVNDVDLFKHMCCNYAELNDVEREIEFINGILEDPTLLGHDKRWFDKRLMQLKTSGEVQNPIDEPIFEIFYENNGNYLGDLDFKGDEFTELIDKTMLKLQLRREGWRLEFNSPEMVENFYWSLVNLDIFENDYYPYRRLVIYYESINEYELVFDTIREFFHSGIYCNRYQYLWFLHKLENVSNVMYISDEDVTDCLRSFKENGFKNKHLENFPVFLAERLYYKRSSLMINSNSLYYATQKKYELKEEAGQLELNNIDGESIEILRKMLENGCEQSPKIYMRLCHSYRRISDLEGELEIINRYLFEENFSFSRQWFEKRLEEINELMEDGERTS